MHFLAIIVSAALVLGVSNAFAVDPAIPGNPVFSTEQLMERGENTSGVFEPNPDETVRHIQSGLVCPAKLPSANLWQLMVFAADGSDAGCSYGRARRGMDENNAETKISLFATKAPAGMTLDQAFQSNLADLHKAFPKAKILGPALTQSGEIPADHPQVRSEESEILLGGRRYINQVLISLVDGWIIKIRATYPAAFAANDPDAGIDIPASAFLWTTTVVSYAKTKQ